MQVEALERLNQMKDDFLSTISHELRSPLTNIKMAIEMLKLVLSNEQIKNSRLSHYLKVLEQECMQELSLINDLLDLQKLETGDQNFEAENVDLRHLLPLIAASFADRIREQQQKLTIDLPLELPFIHTNLSSLRRILVELLHNACKYTPPHEEIRVVARAQDEMLQIRVSNSGVELPAQELPRLFDKFYRVTGVDRWKHGGTGLGLALIKRLVEHLRGSIHVESANSLTCFTVQIPTCLVPENPLSHSEFT
jgi:signal transduction histidine kinase